ncbi:unnamed protein product [Allacma fusca]|uniref:Uncharacterized protein n=1 Tax=Allacma fusca TaxID=39272 RepID=A0A8J2Q3Q2_9HEXA|nr:unnamed protein product [Allacma fusca]
MLVTNRNLYILISSTLFILQAKSYYMLERFIINRAVTASGFHFSIIRANHGLDLDQIIYNLGLDPSIIHLKRPDRFGSKDQN